MQDNEENNEQNQEEVMPSLNDIISSNKEINPNQVTYQKTTTTETKQPGGETKYSYTTTTKTYGADEIKEEGEEENPQESSEILVQTKKDGGENKRYEQEMTIQEEPSSTTKVVKRVIQTEQPTTETQYYEKRVIKTTTTTRSGDNSNQNNRYSNINTTNNVRASGTRYNQGGTSNSTTYTRPTASMRGSDRNNYLRNNDSRKTPSTNRVEQNKYNRGGPNSPLTNSNNYPSQNRNARGNPQNQRRSNTSQSYIGNKNQPKRPETSTHNRQFRSPEQNEIKRKTIDRGNQVKNVQITHIINSKKPQDFHITENLNTESLQTDPIEISKADRAKLKRSGKSTWTTSVQDNVKPIVANLKGKTTVFQHARGIGMTNEKKENVNPMFYTSEIKKLEPIVKEKEKEKVEYMTFRNSGEGNENNSYNNNRNKNSTSNSRTNYNNNYNRGNNNSHSQQKKTYSSNTNPSYTYIPNNRGSSKITNNVRTNQTYKRGNYSGSGNNGEIVKETKTKVQMGSRSQYRNAGIPTSSVTTEKKVYSSNTFFK